MHNSESRDSSRLTFISFFVSQRRDQIIEPILSGISTSLVVTVTPSSEWHSTETHRTVDLVLAAKYPEQRDHFLGPLANCRMH